MILPLLEDAIRYFISRDYPVYLNGFGILFPRIRSIDRSYMMDEKLIVRKESSRTIEFEKCSNLSQYHRDTYQGMVESKELAQRIYALLPIHQALETSERQVREMIDQTTSELIKEVITQGTSKKLSSLGTFYALHNTQGGRFADWFAGSDIFLNSHYSEPFVVSQGIIRERPVLESSWELLTAAYGEPIKTCTVNISKELEGLGYDATELPNDVEHKINIAIYQNYDAREKTHYLLYCSDGLRKQGLKAKRGRGYGTEIVLQLPIGAALDRHNPRDISAIPLWPMRPLTMGWILIQSSPSRTLRAGHKMTEGIPLVSDSDSELCAIFTTLFSQVRDEQLSVEGPFFFVNIVGITQDECLLAEKNGSEQLRTILDYKKLLQYTKPLRSSVIARSAFAAAPKKKDSPYILSDPRLTNALSGSRAFVPA
jgi:nucleoid DNA-binding protein